MYVAVERWCMTTDNTGEQWIIDAAVYHWPPIFEKVMSERQLSSAVDAWCFVGERRTGLAIHFAHIPRKNYFDDLRAASWFEVRT